MKPKKDDPPVQLTLGSTYHVRSLASREAVLDTRGTFRGFVGVGSIDGLAMELDASHKELAGKTRVIPSHMVLSIDILEAAKKDEEAKDELSMHYT
ncbi:MAG TPA: hypothetical protein VFH78_13170 [Candidatus Thermoplasmatota archaeon]|nr:hypothetical protein [Candidatus Thermoplasmatota archaeon]